MLSLPGFECDGDVEGPTGRDRASNSRHDNRSNILELNVGRRFWHKHEALVETVEEALVGFYRTLDPRLLMMAVTSRQIHGSH